ncbi:hypothetical protein C8C83_1598 [Flavobacterium sp. 90]|uniref:DUF6438 domain-containing protein n=1 Tax=unclassified Flavobacterium TaxID=196869 RepID=UPI000F2D5062|nr:MULTISPECIES: hypothetical protein [unclassified Flavobacterium]RKR09937.1 hypothetical protein C8C82_1900 [Flavobacterium sp. 81]TCK53722.1 hypothetical protein C8C83_1598 [Flavobacterium sp. 90]
MKKSIILYLFIICFVSCVSAKNTNKIDNLKTTEEVVKFAKSINPDFAKENFGELQIKPTESITNALNNCDLYKSWNIQNWQKIDLNNDGKTDLLFTGYWYSTYSQYAIVEVESGKYNLFNLSENLEYACKILKPIVVNHKNELLVNNYKTDDESISKRETIHYLDTLTYKFNAFIEINKKVVNYDIESIKFILDNNFEIEVYNNQNAHYNCLNTFNVSNLKGNFYKGESRKKIDVSYFNELGKMLEYINVKDLPNEYTLDGYDFPTVWLEIKFKDGSIKKIKDYGYQGTYGLNAIYDKIKKMALEIDWK